MNTAKENIQVTGMGVITPIGMGLQQFTTGLKNGKTNFSTTTFEREDHVFKFPVGSVDNFNFKELVATLNLNEEIITKAKRLRHISTSTAYGIYCALEAWADAGLNDTSFDLAKVAIVSGGTNTQQATLQMVQEEYREKLQFINPNYGFNFFDTDIIGTLSELLGIIGEGHCIGAASASGNMALIQGHRLISSNEYDVVMVVAPLMDLSMYEYQGFTALGAMAKLSNNINPTEMGRPFDREHAGFVYGQCAGCLVLESATHAAKRNKQPYGLVAGYGISMDANRNPNPSVAGEKKAILKAMEAANINPTQINYVNTHGTGSVIGDDTEAEALIAVGLSGVKANSTKSLTGHGLTAAGVVECIASLIQMKENFLHKSHNLMHPITEKIDWIKDASLSTDINYALTNSFGFGGINTSIIIKNKN